MTLSSVAMSALPKSECSLCPAVTCPRPIHSLFDRVLAFPSSPPCTLLPSISRYHQAKLELEKSSFPRPTLIFQVLTAGDPRLATAVKYHESTRNVADRQAFMAERIRTEEYCRSMAALASALQSKARRALPQDPVGHRFWSERASTTSEQLKDLQRRLKTIEEQLSTFDKHRPIHWSVLDKENGRVMDATAEIKKFLEAWNTSGNGNRPSFPKVSPFVDELIPPFGIKSAPAPAGGTFKDRAPLPPLWTTPSTRTTPPVASQAVPPPTASDSFESRFPNLEAIMNRRLDAPPSTSPCKLIADKIKEISATQAVGVSQEIRNVLDGFLVNLTNQLALFEDGIKERYMPIFRDDGVKVDVVRDEAGDDTERRIPGAFVEKSAPAASPSSAAKASESASTNSTLPGEGTRCCSKPPQPRSNSLYLGTYVCDVCDMTPKAVRWHCNVSTAVRVFGFNSIHASLSYPLQDCRDFDVCYDCLPSLEKGAHDDSHTFTAVYHNSIQGKIVASKAKSGNKNVGVKAQGATTMPGVSASDAPKALTRHNAYCDGCNQR